MEASKQPKVGIVVLNYNGAADTIACLKSLFNITYDNYRIIIVDNSSSDESVNCILDYLKSVVHYNLFLSVKEALEFKGVETRVTMIKSEFNGGFGYGNNIGIQYAVDKYAKYILVLNNDTEVDSGFLEPLVRCCCTNPKIGIAASKIYYFDKPDVFWSNGGSFNSYTFKTTHYNINEKDRGQLSVKNTFLSGCMWLIPTDVILEEGLMREDLFMYMEDVEYTNRLIKAGYQLVCVKESAIWHKVGGSSGGKHSEFSIYWIARNKAILAKENKNVIKIITALFYLIFINSLRLIYKGKSSLVRSHFKGIFRGLLFVKRS